MENKKSLLQKYGIPLNHLDFAYVENCSDSRELEKIVYILRSGEEGFYPDLTKCAEDKLRTLKPGSSLFRIEEPIQSRDGLEQNEWQPIYDWTKDIKVQDGKLSDIKQHVSDVYDDMPPIRKSGKINEAYSNQRGRRGTSTTKAAKPTEVVAATDYRKWDKYDAEVELLKMELEDERVKEEVERKNRINLEKSWVPPRITDLIDEQGEEPNTEQSPALQKLIDVELQHLSEEYRFRGNEFFKAKEYEAAIAEYNKAIKANPTKAAVCYNNRAVAYIKLQKYLLAINDCDKVLSMEPGNIKAMLRKAEASYHYGRRRESYVIYQQVLEEFDANNAIALKATKILRDQLGELAPQNATRLKITEEQSEEQTKEQPKEQTKEQPKEKKKVCTKNKATAPTSKAAKPAAPVKDYDLAKLVVPNRLVKNKFTSAAAALGQAMANSKSKPTTANAASASAAKAKTGNQLKIGKLRASPRRSSTAGKALIEEI